MHARTHTPDSLTTGSWLGDETRAPTERQAKVKGIIKHDFSSQT